MYWNSYVAILVILALPFLILAWATYPVEQRIQEEYIKKGIIRKRDKKLTIRQKHYFYSKTITSLNLVKKELDREPIKTAPSLLFAGKSDILRPIYKDKSLDIVFNKFDNRIVYTLSEEGMQDGKYRYCFYLSSVKKRYLESSYPLMNLILTRLENTFEKLDSNVEVQRKMSQVSASD